MEKLTIQGRVTAFKQDNYRSRREISLSTAETLYLHFTLSFSMDWELWKIEFDGSVRSAQKPFYPITV